MPEMKHNFTKGRMNKDLDERLVPKGEYRDALNVEVSSSESSNVGSLQTTLGNLKVSNPNSGSNTYSADQPSVVGKIADPRNDKIYYFVHKPIDSDGKGEDLIISYSVETSVSEVVFRDIYQYTSYVSVTSNNSSTFYITSTNGLKPNMTINNATNQLVFNSSLWPFAPTIKSFDRATNIVTLKNNDASHSWTLNDKLVFRSKRVLNFNPGNIITGINIIDDLLFWTDNDDEPKKINITRSVLGSQNVAGLATPIEGDYYPTLLYVTGGNTWAGAGVDKGFVEHSHVTVIRPAPTESVKVYTKITTRSLNYDATTDSFSAANVNGTTLAMDWFNSSGDLKEIGDPVDVSISGNAILDYVVGDVLVFNLTNEDGEDGVQEYSIIANLNSYNTNTQTMEVSVMSIDPDVVNLQEVWFVKLKQKKPLFEFKFPRFSYRYKYEDGEYSTFAPWTSVIFTPGEFDYLPKKGYNKGMVNNVRWLGIRNFKPHNIPLDVVAVDILYKEENSPNIYTVKTINSEHIGRLEPADDEWNNTVVLDTTSVVVGTTGMFVLEKDLIHATLPSNQLLRPWDNVPRKALAQEVTGNRIVYGNYIQNFDLNKGNGDRYAPNMEVEIINRINTVDTVNYIAGVKPGTLQAASSNVNQVTITPTQSEVIKIGSKINHSTLIGVIAFVTAINVTTGVITLSKNVTLSNGATVTFDDTFTTIQTVEKTPEKSIKSMRTYQMGVVYTDDFGRETPVQSNDTGTFTVDKDFADKYNQIRVRIQNGPPSWAKYFRYYIKETSNEYYNLAMDRWYDAEDGNVWLSFASADRNKIDEESFIILKKAHEASGLVREDARYKILAISNDAPRFIKETKKIFNSPSLQFHTDGLLREDQKFFSIHQDDVNNSSLAQADTQLALGNGEFQVRVKNGNKKSDWYGLVGIVKDSNDQDYKRFLIEKIFLEDVNFAINLTNTAMKSGTSIDVAQIVAKNKPEFEGKFFAKIYRDSTIDKYLVKNELEKNYIIKMAKSHLTLAADHRHSEPQRKNFWKSPGGWSSCVPTDNGTGWFIDYFVGAWQNNNPNNYNHYDQGIGIFDLPQTAFTQQSTLGRGSLIMLSFSHIGDTATSDLNPGIQSENHPEEVAFAEAISTAGTLFRWSNDPDEVVYRVVAMFASTSYVPGSTWFQNKYLNAIPGKRIDFNGTDGQGNVKVRNWAKHKVNNSNHRWRYMLHVETIEQTTHTGIHIPKGLSVGLNDNSDGAPNVTNPQLSGKWHPLDTGARNSTSVNGYNTTTALGLPFFGESGSGGNSSNGRYSGRQANVALQSSQNDDKGVSSDTAELKGGVNLVTTANSVNNIKATAQYIEILEQVTEDVGSYTSANPGIWETEPKEDVGLDIYYEASRSFRNKAFNATLIDEHGQDDYGNLSYQILDYYNCFSFANGVESNRIRDDYNSLQIGKGVKASTTLAEQFKEERRETGLIYSGIYNSTSGVNNLNQFIQAEKITKDLNPTYGSIQKLHSRDTDLLALCEDKVLKITSNKDALFNADGNPQLIATNRVLGTAVAFVGDYGISTNPESFASDEFRCYFTDKQRGAVLRLSRDGLTNIAEHGMDDYFSDNLTFSKTNIGSYDAVKKTYNLTLKDYGLANGLSSTFYGDNTISFSETVKGWTSLKSFIQEVGGISLNNSYYTFNSGNMWLHHEIFGSTTPINNNFYDTQYDSSVTFIFNEQPGSVKSFKTLNYEGTQAKITENDTDDEYYNNNPKDGWYCSHISTDLQEGKQLEFKDKEGKWFNTLHGVATNLDNLDSKEFSVQGIGNASSINGGNPPGFDLTVTGLFDTCALPCGTPISESGQRGQYRLSMDLGNNGGSGGVAVVTFNTGGRNTQQTLADELVITFNGSSKSEYSAPVGGYMTGLIGANQSTACPGAPRDGWVMNAATGTTTKSAHPITGLNACVTKNVHTMEIFNYDIGVGGFVSANTTTTIPLYGPNNLTAANMGAMTPYGRATKGEMTLRQGIFNNKDAVSYISVPAGNTTNIVDFVVNAPEGGTYWDINITCPGALQSLLGSTVNPSNICGADANVTYYHIPVNVIGTGYVIGSGVPQLHDWIFTDSLGANPLASGSYKLKDGAGGTYSVIVGTTHKGATVHGVITAIVTC